MSCRSALRGASPRPASRKAPDRGSHGGDVRKTPHACGLSPLRPAAPDTYAGRQNGYRRRHPCPPARRDGSAPSRPGLTWRALDRSGGRPPRRRLPGRPVPAGAHTHPRRDLLRRGAHRADGPRNPPRCSTGLLLGGAVRGRDRRRLSGSARVLALRPVSPRLADDVGGHRRPVGVVPMVHGPSSWRGTVRLPGGSPGCGPTHLSELCAAVDPRRELRAGLRHAGPGQCRVPDRCAPDSGTGGGLGDPRHRLGSQLVVEPDRDDAAPRRCRRAHRRAASGPPQPRAVCGSRDSSSS